MTETGTSRVLIDKQHRPVYRAQIEVAEAVRSAVAEAGLERSLVELVNVRVSQINGCAFCLDTHVRAALQAGVSTTQLAVLSAWRDTDLFTDVERAALTLAESLTVLPSSREQDLDYADARAHLTDDQLSAVAWVTVAMNAFNRISIVSRHVPRSAPEGS